ncbi:signal peptidase I [Candidatus Giovannonibacteria bacterium RIFCSPHIGHO2_02_FULL_46_20]|uniref:Signal peptidase I n=1 Tax=Candidatus Giovannonibacteria bacterium RIFCSPHIGHO2_02_FULL_46_20 TaxID=1798338 RepID=A0A1F5WGM6_9BACT|nr:MAG: signal peptidase I [Candidatus Giovannonibacteria bacterium RIFCSPHIGHO2_02_FULL_46_20]
MQNIARPAVVIILSAILLRLFVIDSFTVQGDSMAPSILPGNYVFINKLAYRFGNEPRRGDIVVLATPSTQQKHIIKRIIALPKERIIIENGVIRIKNSREDDGRIIEEQYLALSANGQDALDTPAVGITYINLDPQEYFILGDNRQISIDSRVLGPINKWEIKGRVFVALNLTRFKIMMF